MVFLDKTGLFKGINLNTKPKLAYSRAFYYLCLMLVYLSKRTGCKIYLIKNQCGGKLIFKRLIALFRVVYNYAYCSKSSKCTGCKIDLTRFQC